MALTPRREQINRLLFLSLYTMGARSILLPPEAEHHTTAGVDDGTHTFFVFLFLLPRRSYVAISTSSTSRDGGPAMSAVLVASVASATPTASSTEAGGVKFGNRSANKASSFVFVCADTHAKRKEKTEHQQKKRFQQHQSNLGFLFSQFDLALGVAPRLSGLDHFLALLDDGNTIRHISNKHTAAAQTHLLRNGFAQLFQLQRSQFEQAMTAQEVL